MRLFPAILVMFLSLIGAKTLSFAADNTALQQLNEAVAAGELDGLHSIYVTLKGELVLEAYYAGDDERWGTPLGMVEHGPETLHDLCSVTKSIVGLLYGIALEKGLVPPPDSKVLAQFPEYADLPADPRREFITIEDLLTMRMGIEWNEDLPYSDPRNSEIAMERSEDRYRYILSQPMEKDPGSTWDYCGGASALLGSILPKGTGVPLDQFARTHLFDPLGISTFEWIKGADGVPSAASGLRLTARDLATIGQLLNQDGLFNGTQVVPKSWLEASFTQRTALSNGLRYGYHWYLPTSEGKTIAISGFGNGGQRLTIQPQFDLVMVFFAGNYNQQDAWMVPARVIEDILAPALRQTLRPE